MFFLLTLFICNHALPIVFAFCGADIIDAAIDVHFFVADVDYLFLLSSFEVVFVDAFAWVLSALAIIAYAYAIAAYIFVSLQLRLILLLMLLLMLLAIDFLVICSAIAQIVFGGKLRLLLLLML
jgi:hypothetical protein